MQSSPLNCCDTCILILFLKFQPGAIDSKDKHKFLIISSFSSSLLGAIFFSF